ncbi:MAG: biosynthetic-type acetolactate synthase large subunit, partial [Reinekea forsetii]|nr:biosynthetic-type acetolactate synthase large subunit [Reinekea forsetii]
GPVVIDIPKDMTMPNQKFPYIYPERIKMRSYNPVKKGHSGQIRKAVTLMMQAKKPVIYAGGGVILGRASDELTKMAHLLNFPVTNTLMGLGCFPGTDEQFIGMLGMHGTYESNMAMHNADLIIAIGARLDDRVTNKVSKFCPDAKLIHIDIDPTTISKHIAADVPIVGPVKSVLIEMLEQLEQSGQQIDDAALDQWWAQIDEWRTRHGGRYRTDDSTKMKPQFVIETLARVTKGDAYICTDVGQHQMFAAQYYKFNKPNRWINSGGLGTMGFGLPAAMGVQINYPEADVVCVTGEGSIQMNIQELSTCKQYGLPVKIVCLNNGYLGMVRQWQDMNYESRYSNSYMDSLPDFVKLAESYGHVGFVVESADQLESTLIEAMAIRDKAVFVDVRIDPDEHVYPMQVPNGSMCDMFLSKTERT